MPPRPMSFLIGPGQSICTLKTAQEKEKTAGPQVNTIAADMQLSRSTVKRALQDLVRAGLIEKEPRYREKRKPHLQPPYFEKRVSRNEKASPARDVLRFLGDPSVGSW